MSGSGRPRVDYRVRPGGALRGRAAVPGDKSISHRAVLLGAVAEGTTRIEGFLAGEDTLATLGALAAMGAGVERAATAVALAGRGLDGLRAPARPLDLGNSGTALRLLAGLLAGQPFDTVLGGDASLSRRPMGRIVEPLRRMGAQVSASPDGTPPLAIRGGARLTGIRYELPVASAQVKSCLLLAGLYAGGRTTVVEPAPTRDHTERMLAAFGYPVEAGGGTVSVAGRAAALRGIGLAVPGDLSSAAFLLVGASIAPGSELTLEGVGVNPTRDGVLRILERMGARIAVGNRREVGGEPLADLRVGPARLRGCEIPPEWVPLAIDEFPALLVAAACAEGTTRLAGAGELRVKESDRIATMAAGLAALGVACEPTPDGMVVHGGGLRGGRVRSGGDHRVAMAFAVAALAAREPVVVEDCANVATSFPGFPELAAELGLGIEVVRDGGAASGA